MIPDGLGIPPIEISSICPMSSMLCTASRRWSLDGEVTIAEVGDRGVEVAGDFDFII
jgi:hypothetical protein